MPFAFSYCSYECVTSGGGHRLAVMTTHKTDESASEERPIPSQAEGDDPPQSGIGTRPVPSQAEGDEATIDEALRKQDGGKGK